MLSPAEIGLVGGAFLLLFGASRIPALARGLGAAPSAFKDAREADGEADDEDAGTG